MTLLERPWQFETEWARWLWRVDALLPLLLLPGLWWLGRHVGRAALAPASVLVLHPLAMALLAPYRAPVLPGGPVFHPAPPARARRRRRPPRSALLLVSRALRKRLRWLQGGRLGWLAAAALLVGAVAALPSAATRYGWAVQNIEAMQVHLGHWVARHTPPAARIGLNDVGAITYVSRREIVDVMGLVTPAIIPFRRDGETGVLRYLEQACPDYLIVFPAWFPAISKMTDRFRSVYRSASLTTRWRGPTSSWSTRRLEPMARGPATLSGRPGRRARGCHTRGPRKFTGDRIIATRSP